MCTIIHCYWQQLVIFGDKHIVHLLEILFWVVHKMWPRNVLVVQYTLAKEHECHCFWPSLPSFSYTYYIQVLMGFTWMSLGRFVAVYDIYCCYYEYATVKEGKGWWIGHTTELACGLVWPRSHCIICDWGLKIGNSLPRFRFLFLWSAHFVSA